MAFKGSITVSTPSNLVTVSRIRITSVLLPSWYICLAVSTIDIDGIRLGTRNQTNQHSVPEERNGRDMGAV